MKDKDLVLLVFTPRYEYLVLNYSLEFEQLLHDVFSSPKYKGEWDYRVVDKEFLRSLALYSSVCSFVKDLVNESFVKRGVINGK